MAKVFQNATLEVFHMDEKKERQNALKAYRTLSKQLTNKQ